MKYVPVTPGGTYCDWLISDTVEQAWEKLMKDASHMPYEGKKDFINRGYMVVQVEDEQ